jgi:putative oxidoreductase
MMLPHLTPVYEKWAPVVARVLLGAYFFHGSFYKIPGTAFFDMAVQGSQAVGLPFPVIAVSLAFLLEFFGGLALIVGFHTRTAAVLLSGFMVLIAIFFFRDWSSQMNMGMFINCIGVAAGLLYVSVYGAQNASLKTCQLPAGIQKVG